MATRTERDKVGKGVCGNVVIVLAVDIAERLKRANVMDIQSLITFLALTLSAYTALIAVALTSGARLRHPVGAVVLGLAARPSRMRRSDKVSRHPYTSALEIANRHAVRANRAALALKRFATSCARKRNRPALPRWAVLSTFVLRHPRTLARHAAKGVRKALDLFDEGLVLNAALFALHGRSGAALPCGAVLARSMGAFPFTFAHLATEVVRVALAVACVILECAATVCASVCVHIPHYSTVNPIIASLTITPDDKALLAQTGVPIATTEADDPIDHERPDGAKVADEDALRLAALSLELDLLALEIDV